MKGERIILLHGLGESSLRMMPLALYLKSYGYEIINVDYPSTIMPTEELAERYLAPIIRQYEGAKRLHFVTHSMGSIMLRYYLQHHAIKHLGRIVMLTPANHGSEIFEIYRHHPVFAFFYGPPAQQSGIGEESLPCQLPDSADFEVGIIAGTLPLDPISWAVVPWPQDGRVSVESTKLKGMKDHTLVPATHEFLPFHPLALYQVQQFLEHGRFAVLPSPYTQRQIAA